MSLPARAEVVVVGAGLAGLSAAVRLAAAGCDVHVLEAGQPRRGAAGDRAASTASSSTAASRCSTPAIPGRPTSTSRRCELGWFDRGAVIRVDGRAHRVVDPRRRPTVACSARSAAPIGGLREKAALAAFSARAGYRPVSTGCCRPGAHRRGGAAAARAWARPRWSASSAPSSPACCSRASSPRPAATSTCSGAASCAGRIGLPAARHAGGRRAAGRRLDPERLHLGTAGPRGRLPARWRPTAGSCRPTPSSSPPTRRRPPAAARPWTRPRRAQVTTHLHVLPASPWPTPLIVLGAAGWPAGEQRRPHRRPARLQPRRPGAGGQLDAGSRPPRPTSARRSPAAHGVAPADLAHLTTRHASTGAQPAALPPLQLRRPVDLGDGLYVCGDHRDTPSIQGAMASGARAARAVLRRAAPVVHPARGAA